MVYVCICMYIYVYTYMHVFPARTSPDTGTNATFPKHNRRATVRASEHPLVSAIGKGCADPIWRIPPRCTRPGPLRDPSRSARRSPMHNPRTIIQSNGLSQQIWSVGVHTDARGLRPPPLKNTSRPRFAGVCICICMYMRICMYM